MITNENICGNCKHNKNVDGEWVCMNNNSDMFGCDVNYDDQCVNFEPK